jgi:hypothetical protein
MLAPAGTIGSTDRQPRRPAHGHVVGAQHRVLQRWNGCGDAFPVEVRSGRCWLAGAQRRRATATEHLIRFGADLLDIRRACSGRRSRRNRADPSVNSARWAPSRAPMRAAAALPTLHAGPAALPDTSRQGPTFAPATTTYPRCCGARCGDDRSVRRKSAPQALRRPRWTRDPPTPTTRLAEVFVGGGSVPLGPARSGPPRSRLGHVMYDLVTHRNGGLRCSTENLASHVEPRAQISSDVTGVREGIGRW